MDIEKYSNCIIATDNNVCIMQNGFDFYQIRNYEKNLYVDGDLISKYHIKDCLSLVIINILVIFVSLALYFNFADYTIIDTDFDLSMFILFINIIIHELGHIISLKVLFKDSKFKIGFKFFFVFPAFYVDTSYSYLLPKYKKISVYLAGTTFNALFLLMIYFLNPKILQYCNILVSNMIINFLPIVKSDGYYSAITFFNKYGYYKSKRMEKIEDFVRGLFMWLFMLIISFVF